MPKVWSRNESPERPRQGDRRQARRSQSEAPRRYNRQLAPIKGEYGKFTDDYRLCSEAEKENIANEELWKKQLPPVSAPPPPVSAKQRVSRAKSRRIVSKEILNITINKIKDIKTSFELHV